MAKNGITAQLKREMMVFMPYSEPLFKETGMASAQRVLKNQGGERWRYGIGTPVQASDADDASIQNLCLLVLRVID